MDRLDALEARIEANELFLQQLVLLLEVEPELTAENIASWLMLTRDRMRDHQVVAPPVLAAFGNLIDRVTALLPHPPESDDKARQAAKDALKKVQRRKPPG